MSFESEKYGKNWGLRFEVEEEDVILADMELKGLNKSDYLRRGVKKELHFDDLYVCLLTILKTMEAIRHSSKIVEREKPSPGFVEQLSKGLNK